MPKHYVDIRVHFDLETEEDGEYTTLRSFERIKVKNLTEGHLSGIGDSLMQMDSWQIALASQLPHTIHSGNTTTLKD